MHKIHLWDVIIGICNTHELRTATEAQHRCGRCLHWSRERSAAPAALVKPLPASEGDGLAHVLRSESQSEWPVSASSRLPLWAKGLVPCEALAGLISASRAAPSARAVPQLASTTLPSSQPFFRMASSAWPLEAALFGDCGETAAAWGVSTSSSAQDAAREAPVAQLIKESSAREDDLGSIEASTAIDHGEEAGDFQEAGGAEKSYITGGQVDGKKNWSHCSASIVEICTTEGAIGMSRLSSMAQPQPSANRRWFRASAPCSTSETGKTQCCGKCPVHKLPSRGSARSEMPLKAATRNQQPSGQALAEAAPMLMIQKFTGSEM